jgi:hypothetical protein
VLILEDVRGVTRKSRPYHPTARSAAPFNSALPYKCITKTSVSGAKEYSAAIGASGDIEIVWRRLGAAQKFSNSITSFIYTLLVNARRFPSGEGTIWAIHPAPTGISYNTRGLPEQQSRIVELRFFGGLSIEETARAMNLSPTTVKKYWAMARLWLHHQMAKAVDA